jgi:hypothetical protein
LGGSSAWLVSDQRKSRKERWIAKLMHAELVQLEYAGSYELVAAFVRESSCHAQSTASDQIMEPPSESVRNP